MLINTQDFEKGCQLLAAKFKHYLITTIGKTLDDASTKDIYSALSLALREEVMLHWLATWRSYRKAQVKTLYYLSMEYLPGRLTQSVLTNLKADPAIRRVLEIIGKPDYLKRFSERDPALGNGGLGRLASCIMESLATGSYPAMGYGLRYQYGLFEQELWAGSQVERPDWWVEETSPWEFRRDSRGQLVHYFGRMHLEKNIWGEEVAAIRDSQNVRATPFDIPLVGYNANGQFNVNTLRLWSTRESPRNFELQRFNAGELDSAAENITLTDVLYPSDQHEVGRRLRMKQEYLLVSASVKDIVRRHKAFYGSCDDLPDKAAIQINDTHPALAVAELIYQLTAREQMPWKKALEITQATIAYTNHTIMREALEEWPQLQIQNLLPRQYRVIERLNYEFCQQVRTYFKGDENRVQQLSILQDGKVRMAHLAFYGSHCVNGVAKLHTTILQESIFRDFHAIFPDRIIAVTNGVTPRKWILGANPELAKLYCKHLGEGWISDLAQLRQLEPLSQDHQFLTEFMQIKRQNKQNLIDSMHEFCVLRDEQGNPRPFQDQLNCDMIFDVQVKRIHEYKRQLLNVLHLISLYQEMLENPMARLPRLVIFAGKAAANYQMAKRVIRLISALERVINADSRLEGRLKVHFLENYNVSLAEKIIPAADLSEQISTAGLEASGTGNMKLSMNGALTIGTDDGANVEMRESVGDADWPFLFGATTKEIDELRLKGYQPQQLYHSDPQIRRILDSLIGGVFAKNDEEAKDFEAIYNGLLGLNNAPADPYFIVHDLPSYIAAQKKVDVHYAEPLLWAKLSFLNAIRMDPFSIDRCVADYAKKVWNLKPAPIDKVIYDNVSKQFNEYAN